MFFRVLMKGSLMLLCVYMLAWRIVDLMQCQITKIKYSTTYSIIDVFWHNKKDRSYLTIYKDFLKLKFINKISIKLNIPIVKYLQSFLLTFLLVYISYTKVFHCDTSICAYNVLQSNYLTSLILTKAISLSKQIFIMASQEMRLSLRHSQFAKEFHPLHP
jgi:hypothetical protein